MSGLDQRRVWMGREWDRLSASIDRHEATREPCPRCASKDRVKREGFTRQGGQKFFCRKCNLHFSLSVEGRAAEGRPKDKARRDDCPECRASEHVRKGGKDSGGLQRYLCTACNRWFREHSNLPLSMLRDPALRSIRFICWRCGFDGCDLKLVESWRTGLRAWCPQCRLYFRQGGAWDVKHNWLCLRQRIDAAADIPPDLRDSVFQQAALDVLEGRGYCFNVPLRVVEAMREAWGSGRLGGDHPTYRRLAEGQYPQPE